MVNLNRQLYATESYLTATGQTLGPMIGYQAAVRGAPATSFRYAPYWSYIISWFETIVLYILNENKKLKKNIAFYVTKNMQYDFL